MAVDRNWYKGTQYEPMINELSGLGVEVIAYRDRNRPRDKAIPVFNQKAFFDALGIPYNAEAMARPSNTYIEVYAALRRWAELRGVEVD